MAHDLLSIQNDRYQYQFIGNNNQKQSREVGVHLCACMRSMSPASHRPLCLHSAPPTSQVLLNDKDPLWARVRHMHIAELGTLLHQEYKQLLADNPEVRPHRRLWKPITRRC